MIIRAAVTYFALVMGTGFVFGVVRVPFVVPRIGERWAELAEMPFMAAAIFLAAGYVLRRFPDARLHGRSLAVGFLALALLICTELALAITLQSRTLAGYIASRDPVSGTVYLVMLMALALMPWFRSRSYHSSVARLHSVKTIHTVAWAFFVGCILAIPVFAVRGDFQWAAALIAVVSVEVVVIVANDGRCPLTAIAAQYTDDRRDNFDIYLPLWMARYNKHIFGSLFAAGSLLTLARWRGWCV